MGKVEITVVEARGLRNKQLVGVPDPFVRIICNDKKYKTAEAKDTLNPIWNETFRFQVADENSTQIELEVWNKGVVNDDLLGYYDLSLGGLIKGIVKDEWYILEKSKTLAELRVRVLAVDFGAKPAPEDEWKVTTDINHDPVKRAIEDGTWSLEKIPQPQAQGGPKSPMGKPAPAPYPQPQMQQPQMPQPPPGQFMPPPQPAPYSMQPPYPQPQIQQPQMPQPPPGQFAPPYPPVPYPVQPQYPQPQMMKAPPGQFAPPYSPVPPVPYPVQPQYPQPQMMRPPPGQFAPPYTPAPAVPYPVQPAYPPGVGYGGGAQPPVGGQPPYGYYNMAQPPVNLSPLQPGYRY